MSVMLSAKEIKKNFYNPSLLTILQSINLDICVGEAVAITGRSGEGKSTLLQILGTLEPPTEGSLIIAGQTVTRFNKSAIRNKHIAFVFQSFHLLEDYTALDNVLMPARIARKNVAVGSEAHQRALTLLDQVGLAHRMHHPTKLLSGGEKQRVAIARAFCNNPDLIFADEPSGNLDEQTAKGIHSLLINYTRSQGKSLVLATHSLDLANLCDKQYVLAEGTLTPAF